MISLPYERNRLSLFARKTFIDGNEAIITLELATKNKSGYILESIIGIPPLVGLGLFSMLTKWN